MENKKLPELSTRDIRNSLLLGLKYLTANLFTSFLMFAFHFIIGIIIGLETNQAKEFFSGALVHTIMMPLVILYYGYIAYNDGYRHSVGGIYDKRRIYLATLPIIAVQLICIFWAIKVNLQLEAPDELNPANLVSKFLMAPFTILFNQFPLLMPELMLLPVCVPPIAMILGYRKARGVEIQDHDMSQDAIEFRKQLEMEQYKYENEADNENENKE